MAVALVRTCCNSSSSANVSPLRAVDHHTRPFKRGSVSSNRVILTKLRSERVTFSATTVISSYVAAGLMEDALRVFDAADRPDTFLWNLMIKGYVNNEFYEEAIALYRRMQLMGICADNYTFPFLIKACWGLFSLDEGTKMHSYLMKTGYNFDLFICNSLITMYAKLGCVESAEKVFHEMSVRDAVSWNALINGYSSNGNGWKALLYFIEMQAQWLEIDRFTLIGALGACSLERYQKQGKEIHCYAIRCGFESDLMIQTSLLDMYGKCRNMGFAERLFHGICRRNVVHWNVLVSGYVSNNQPHKACSCLIRMQEDDHINPDLVTLLNVLPACANNNHHLEGKSLHGFAIRKGLLPHLVLETALMDFYVTCCETKSAVKLFDAMDEKNLISWNTLIKAYVQDGQYMHAIQLFHDLIGELGQQDEVTLSSIIPAYTELGFLRQGRQIHCYALKQGYGLNTFILNSLIYMYAKCGDLESSQKIFAGITEKDVVSWNAIIMGYGIHGYGRVALELFSVMQGIGIPPNRVSFISVLSSCSNNGLIEEGWQYFTSMKQDFGIEPQIEHYGCMVDLIGRTGNLDSALSFIEKMPIAPTARIWGSLLTASKNHQNIEMAKFAAEKILSFKHNNTGCYVLLSNLYADANRWEDVKRIRSLMKDAGLEKTMGCSTLELDSKTCSFINGDRSHKKGDIIHDTLEILTRRIGEPIDLPSIKFRPQDEVKKKADLPTSHSVRLAICYGLISTAVGDPLLIKKNIRMCNDCHHVAKLISAFSRREIVVGDSVVFHHFKDGNCCCGDYW
ncbi:pentatricopeptide repeat-containing protein At4g35130, chloroplastic [Aristolochia californica]|uniref:pentatricopeptide repeat-containing protein At4g35130, chloroplastic n=1 Tax=Aristolochia californica TaxID=171875 RepID=UPI0035E0324E